MCKITACLSACVVFGLIGLSIAAIYTYEDVELRRIFPSEFPQDTVRRSGSLDAEHLGRYAELENYFKNPKTRLNSHFEELACYEERGKKICEVFEKKTNKKNSNSRKRKFTKNGEIKSSKKYKDVDDENNGVIIKLIRKDTKKSNNNLQNYLNSKEKSDDTSIIGLSQERSTDESNLYVSEKKHVYIKSQSVEHSNDKNDDSAQNTHPSNDEFMSQNNQHLNWKENAEVSKNKRVKLSKKRKDSKKRHLKMNLKSDSTFENQGSVSKKKRKLDKSILVQIYKTKKDPSDSELSEDELDSKGETYKLIEYELDYKGNFSAEQARSHKTPHEESDSGLDLHINRIDTNE